MRFKRSWPAGCSQARVIGIASMVALAAVLLLPGCGDDGGFKPAPEILPASSPENVINNLAVCYARRDGNQLAALFDEDFVFRFTEHDILHYPGLVPEGGVWSKSNELEVTEYMFDRCNPPTDMLPSIAGIKMIVKSSGSSVLCNLIGAPPGTIEMAAHMHLTVRQKIPNVDYDVVSMPLFYFVPDGPDSARTWKLWMIEDDAPVHDPRMLAAPGDGSTTVPVLQVSWGWVKGLYWSYMRDH